jgi:hypothetical protein
MGPRRHPSQVKTFGIRLTVCEIAEWKECAKEEHNTVSELSLDAHRRLDQRVSVARWTTRIGNDCTSGTPFAPPVLFGVFHDTIRISNSIAAPIRW